MHLYLRTPFLGDEGNASGSRASAHALLRRVVLVVMAPVFVLFLPLLGAQEEGDLKNVHGTKTQKTRIT